MTKREITRSVKQNFASSNSGHFDRKPDKTGASGIFIFSVTLM